MEKELNVVYNQDGNIASITTNFQEDLDSFEVEEISTIIIDLINSVIDKVKRDIATEEIGERNLEELENDEMEEIIAKINEQTSDFTGSLIYDIVNFVNNKDKEKLKQYSYSLAVYDTDNTHKCKEIYETYHYGELQEHEKLLSCFAFYKDIADGLIEKNSKEAVKQVFKKAFAIMLYNIYNYIEKYNSTDE